MAPTPVLETLKHTIEDNRGLNAAGTTVKKAIHQRVLHFGAPGRTIADLLHGTWLGHPLHPLLTDVTIGAWVSGVTLDLLSKLTGRRNMREAADTLVTLGTLSAVPTALAGITDYSTIKRQAVGTGAAHGVLNSLALTCFTLSVAARRNDDRDRGFLLSAVGLGLSMLSAWLGGDLVYRQRVGVDHAPPVTVPGTWTPVATIESLTDGTPQRMDVNGTAILLYRQNAAIYAVGAVCPHAGGPLDQGDFDGHCVTCPWHQSVFDLRDGSIVHGPTTFPAPSFETRINAGMVEIRATGA